MPLVLILYLGVYVPIVAMSSVADAVQPAHREECWRPIDAEKARFPRDWWSHPRYHQSVPGWRWLIPYPARKGKYRIDFVAGDRDDCTGETFNGKWWYRP